MSTYPTVETIRFRTNWAVEGSDSVLEDTPTWTVLGKTLEGIRDLELSHLDGFGQASIVYLYWN